MDGSSLIIGIAIGFLVGLIIKRYPDKGGIFLDDAMEATLEDLMIKMDAFDPAEVIEMSIAIASVIVNEEIATGKHMALLSPDGSIDKLWILQDLYKRKRKR